MVFYFRVANIILGFGLKCYIGEKNELKKQFCLEGEICVTHVNSKYPPFQSQGNHVV